MNNLDQMTRQNAAIVSPTTDLSHTLAQGSATLAELVGRFQLNRRAARREPGSDAEKASPTNRPDTSHLRKRA